MVLVAYMILECFFVEESLEQVHFSLFSLFSLVGFSLPVDRVACATGLMFPSVTTNFGTQIEKACEMTGLRLHGDENRDWARTGRRRCFHLRRHSR